MFNVTADREWKVKSISQTEQKLLRVCTAATCIWFISWTPYAVIFLLPMLGGRHLVSPSLDMVPAVFSKLAAAINPIIYGLLWVDMTCYNIDDELSNDSSGCQSSYCAPSVCLEDDHHGALWWGTWGVWEGRELLVTHSLNLDLRIWITIGINILVDLRYNVCPAYKRRWNV